MRSANASWVARHKNGAWYSLVLVVVVAVVCTGVVATVHTMASDAFAQADLRLDEAEGGAQRALIFPDATFEKVSAPAVEGLDAAYTVSTGGYVFEVSCPGYAGNVTLMVGISSEGTVAGVQVVEHTETNGIGTNALTDEYLGSFVDLPASSAVTLEEASSGATHVDAVSGATFTSKAVVDGINVAFDAYAQMGGN